MGGNLKIVTAILCLSILGTLQEKLLDNDPEKELEANENYVEDHLRQNDERERSRNEDVDEREDEPGERRSNDEDYENDDGNDAGNDDSRDQDQLTSETEGDDEKRTEDELQKQAPIAYKRTIIPKQYDSCAGLMCQMGITAIGCYHDSYSPRPLPLLLDTHRDLTSHVSHGVSFDWFNAKKSIKRLTCDCARLARKYGHTHFGLQFYGECWSSKTAARDYAKDGPATACINAKYQKCKTGEYCVGQAHTNYVYRVEPLVLPPVYCKEAYTKVGCFYDPVTKARPLPELLDTHRDLRSHASHGKTLKWDKFKHELQTLLCHCAAKAKAKGYKYFGIQYYGECWSGKTNEKTYNLYGTSKHCVNTDYKQCNGKTDCSCAGKGHALFVYKLN